jgi:flagellar basal body rod protein FlgG
VNPYRIALYYAPGTDDPLHQRASAWLGRDAASGAQITPPAIAGVDIAEVTADARGYVLTPNVNRLVETADMRAAQRSYEANLNAIEAARGLAGRTIDLLK